MRYWLYTSVVGSLMSNEILVAPAMELVTFTIPLTGKTGWLVVRTSILVDVARLSHPALLLLVVVKLSKVGFAASASTVNEYVRSAARVLPTVSFKEYAGILMWMISPAGYFCVPVSDMVMTCRVIDVAIVSVMELLEESTRRGFKAPPLLYEIDSSKYRVIVDSLRTPVAPLAGTMEVAYTVGLFASSAGVEAVQMSLKLTVAFALEPAIKNMVSSWVITELT